MSNKPIDAFNFALVGARGDRICIMNPAATLSMTKEQALVLAAYLVSLADFGDTQFAEVLKAVQSA